LNPRVQAAHSHTACGRAPRRGAALYSAAWPAQPHRTAARANVRLHRLAPADEHHKWPLLGLLAARHARTPGGIQECRYTFAASPAPDDTVRTRAEELHVLQVRCESRVPISRPIAPPTAVPASLRERPASSATDDSTIVRPAASSPDDAEIRDRDRGAGFAGGLPCAASSGYEGHGYPARPAGDAMRRSIPPRHEARRGNERAGCRHEFNSGTGRFSRSALRR